MVELLRLYQFFKYNRDKLIVIFLIWFMFTLMFVQDVFGKHYDSMQIPNNGIVSFYDFEGSQTGDPIFPDKVGKNDGVK